jgi:hypothetical protein
VFVPHIERSCGFLGLEWACRAAALRGALDAGLPFVDPEVIKLDLRLVQERPSPAIAAIVHAVNAQSERSGAVLLAEGIETQAQRHLEAQVAAQGDAAVIFAAFQDARHLTARTAARYERLASHAALVGGLEPEPVPGVRGAALDASDVLAGEWNVTMIAPHFAAAFVAQDLGDETCADMERQFDFCLTYDRDLAIEAAGGLLARVAPR